MGNCIQQISEFFNIFGACEFNIGRDRENNQTESREDAHAENLDKLIILNKTYEKNLNINK